MKIFEYLSGWKKEKFIYPYSADFKVRREQIWDNLQKGILIENSGVFIPWKTKYKHLDKYKKERMDSGDRTVWYLGKQKMLNGLDCHIEVLKWTFQPDTSSFDQISDNLGFDKDGYHRFNRRIDYLINLFGNQQKQNWINLEFTI